MEIVTVIFATGGYLWIIGKIFFLQKYTIDKHWYDLMHFYYILPKYKIFLKIVIIYSP